MPLPIMLMAFLRDSLVARVACAKRHPGYCDGYCGGSRNEKRTSNASAGALIDLWPTSTKQQGGLQFWAQRNAIATGIYRDVHMERMWPLLLDSGVNACTHTQRQ